MNILYIGDLNSIHDFKWVTYFSEQKDTKVFFTTVNSNYEKYIKNKKLDWIGKGVQIIPAINSFSILKPFQTISSVRALNTFIKENNIDIVHVLFGSPQPMYIPFFKNNVKSMITTRGSDVLIMFKRLVESKRLMDFVLRKFLMRGFSKSDFIVSTSKKQVEFIREIESIKTPVKVVKTGVDVESVKKAAAFNRVKTKREKFIFSARYIAPVYNMEYQLDAIRELPYEILKEFSFLFIKSKGHDQTYIQKFQQELDKIPNLVYDIVEGMSQDEMWGTIKSAFLTYMVPKSDGTPNTALECMAAKKPFILGDLDYNKELFEGVSLICDLSSPISLAENIKVGLTNYPVDLLNTGLNKVESFGNRQVEMEKLNKIYKDLLN